MNELNDWIDNTDMSYDANKYLKSVVAKIAELEADALRLLEIIQSSYLYSNEWNEINEIEKRLKRGK